MNNDPLNEKWRELSWRQKLTAGEEAELRGFLAAHSEAGREWEDETGLNRLLQQLPDVPIASNFTTRVLAAAGREWSRPPRARLSDWRWWLRAVAPRAVLASFVLAMGLAAWHYHEVEQRIQLAQNLALISKAGPLPSPEALANFDTIRSLSQTPPPDEELLALLK